MTVAKGRSPGTAYSLVVSYTAGGQHHMAARVYVESSLSYKRYLEAITEGRRRSGSES